MLRGSIFLDKCPRKETSIGVSVQHEGWGDLGPGLGREYNGVVECRLWKEIVKTLLCHLLPVRLSASYFSGFFIMSKK